ncbi:MAG: FMN-binding negative transcriptional regulator [Rhodobacteraceae bacterium]|nr:FMN-binding negative transcriptional regulator [Paracoccaceae bacterium]
MHPNPVYRSEDRARILAFAADRGFGMLAVNGPDAPMLSHVPFVLTGDAGAGLHLVRSNPIARALAAGEAAAVLAVAGPDSYVSPDWYELDDQVPTWNYAAVHLRGRLRLLADGELRAHLEALSATFEKRLPGKTPWRLDKVDSQVQARLMRMIVPVALEIEGVDGTWKLAQNKPEAARLAAADGIEQAGIGQEVAALAALMRGAG